MAAQKKSPKTVSSEAFDSTVQQEVGEAVVLAQATEEEDRVAPIQFKNSGIRMGVSVYVPSEKVSFAWHDTRTGEQAKLPLPLAVRVKREGGENYRLEFFFPNSSENEIGVDKFDNKTFTLRLGLNEETQRVQGRRFRSLVGAGWGRDSLPQLDSDLRFLKYICHTDQINHFDEIPRKLPGLGLPLKDLI